MFQQFMYAYTCVRIYLGDVNDGDNSRCKMSMQVTGSPIFNHEKNMYFDTKNSKFSIMSVHIEGHIQLWTNLMLMTQQTSSPLHTKHLSICIQNDSVQQHHTVYVICLWICSHFHWEHRFCKLFWRLSTQAHRLVVTFSGKGVLAKLHKNELRVLSFDHWHPKILKQENLLDLCSPCNLSMHLPQAKLTAHAFYAFRGKVC